MRAAILIAFSIVLLPVIVRPTMASEIWIFAIFGLGLNLLLGYTGLLNMANTAHAVGLTMGVAWGYLAARFRV